MNMFTVLLSDAVHSSSQRCENHYLRANAYTCYRLRCYTHTARHWLQNESLYIMKILIIRSYYNAFLILIIPIILTICIVIVIVIIIILWI